jgi:hypothetical protein
LTSNSSNSGEMVFLGDMSFAFLVELFVGELFRFAGIVPL